MPRPLLLPAARVALVVCLGSAVSAVAAAPPAARHDESPAASAEAKQQALAEAARVARRDRHRAILAALWGPSSAEPAGLAEFDLHAWRMARLHRMERLAHELARPALLDRITPLLAKEQARHLKHMKRLQGPAAAPPARKD